MKKITRIKNKCLKYGCDFHFEEVGEEFRELTDERKNKYTARFVVVDVEGVAVVNGWKFIASVEHTEKGNIIRAACNIEVPERYYTSSPICEHCKSKRFRKDTYIVMNEETGENFDYTSSIDSDTYNKVKLTYDNEETGKREVYIAQDGSHINEWGILQYFDTLSKGENGQAKADALLQLYNKKTRNLKITNALGDTRVRAGSMVVVNLDLGDMKLKNFMLVEKVTHKFNLDEHFMDLTLRGGEFVA